MKITPSVSGGRAPRPHPVGPTMTSGQRPGSDGRTRRKACTRRSRFLRGSRVPTVSRNSPGTPARRSKASAAASSGGARWSVPPGTTLIRASSTPNATRSAATRPGRHDEGGPTVAGAVEGPFVPARRAGVVASGWRRQATSCTVTTRRLELPVRSMGAANDTECTTSKPFGARSHEWSQALVSSGPGSVDAITGRPKALSGSSWPRGQASDSPGASPRRRRPRRRTGPARPGGRAR